MSFVLSRTLLGQRLWVTWRPSHKTIRRHPDFLFPNVKVPLRISNVHTVSQVTLATTNIHIKMGSAYFSSQFLTIRTLRKRIHLIKSLENFNEVHLREKHLSIVMRLYILFSIFYKCLSQVWWHVCISSTSKGWGRRITVPNPASATQHISRTFSKRTFEVGLWV